MHQLTNISNVCTRTLRYMKRPLRMIKGIFVLLALGAILLLADRKHSTFSEKKITLIEIDYNLATTSEDTHAGIIDGLKAEDIPKEYSTN